MCPTCGEFGATETTVNRDEFRTQYRVCRNGHRFQTVIRIDDR